MNETEKALLEQVRNASLGRYRHFESAGRHDSWNSWIGVPVVLVNVLLSSVFFWALTEDIPQIMKWVAAFLALVAAMLSGLQTFFSFSRMFEGHRRLGNRYLEIMRETERVIALKKDRAIEEDEFMARAENLFRSYQQINRDGEGFPTKQKDFEKALKQENLRVSSSSSRDAREGA